MTAKDNSDKKVEKKNLIGITFHVIKVSHPPQNDDRVNAKQKKKPSQPQPQNAFIQRVCFQTFDKKMHTIFFHLNLRTTQNNNNKKSSFLLVHTSKVHNYYHYFAHSLLAVEKLKGITSSVTQMFAHSPKE